MKFNEKLQTLRKERKISQEQLAEQLDVSRQAVSKWESGTTYPEMDKLISICRIFNCNLEDLTNDNIKHINVESNKKSLSNLGNIIFEEIKKIYQVFTNMDFKEFIKFCLFMGFIALIVGILFIPLNGFRLLMNNIYYNFGNLYYIFSSVTKLIVYVVYFFLAVGIFYYAFKLRYLENIEPIIINKEEQVKDECYKEKQDDVNKQKNIKKEPVVIIKHNHDFLDAFANVIIGFIKVVVGICSIPFIFTMIAISIAFAIFIYLLFKGIVCIGAIICIIGILILNILLLKMAFYFVFNHKINIKTTFIISIGSLMLLGVGSGIFIAEITEYQFINSIPPKTNTITNYYEYEMKEDLYFDIYSSYYYDFSYEEDASLEDKVVIEHTYYNKFANYEINLSDTNHLYVDLIDSKITNITAEVLENLKDKKIYNYDLYNKQKIVIKSSKKNIDLIKANYESFLDGQKREYEKSLQDYYENLIEEYEREIEELHMQLEE